MHTHIHGIIYGRAHTLCSLLCKPLSCSHTHARVRTCTDSRIHTHAHMRAPAHTRVPTPCLAIALTPRVKDRSAAGGTDGRRTHAPGSTAPSSRPERAGSLPLRSAGRRRAIPGWGGRRPARSPRSQIPVWLHPPASSPPARPGSVPTRRAGVPAERDKAGGAAPAAPPPLQRPPHARAPGAQASWPGPNLSGLITPFSVIISGARRDGRRGKVRSAVDVGQGAGGKQLPSSLERASALGLWQKLGLSGLKPGRGELSGVRARPSGWSIRRSFLSRHFHRLFVSNPSNSLLRLLLTNSVPTARLRRRQSSHFCLRLGLSHVLPIWGNSFPGHLCSLGPISASEFSQGHSHLPVLSRRRKKREAREGEGTPLPHGTAGSIQKP